MATSAGNLGPRISRQSSQVVIVDRTLWGRAQGALELVLAQATGVSARMSRCMYGMAHI